MKNEFKAGDLVFELSDIEGISLTEVTTFDNKTYSLRGNSGVYTANGQGFGNFKSVPSLFHATSENRKALVMLYGEVVVPKLPLSPQEVTLKLLENQKYQLCKVSNHNNKEWQFNNVLKAVVRIGTHGEFIDSNGEGWTYGIPVDNNGNEITEIE